MNIILSTAPDGAIPEQHSPAYRLLCLLAESVIKPRDELCNELGGGFRAYLQQLTGGYYQHWLIHSEQREYNGQLQSHYWLDERHYSGDWEADKDARTIARKRYNDRSYYGSKGAAKRLEQAKKEKAEADREYNQRIESKKPSKD